MQKYVVCCAFTVKVYGTTCNGIHIYELINSIRKLTGNLHDIIEYIYAKDKLYTYSPTLPPSPHREA